MTFILLLVAIVILLCVIAEKFSGNLVMPALILFIHLCFLAVTASFIIYAIIWQKIYVPSFKIPF